MPTIASSKAWSRISGPSSGLALRISSTSPSPAARLHRKTKDVPLSQILARNAAGTSQPLTFAREGSGTLFYASRLRYVPEETFLDGLDNGIRVARSYAPYVENATRPAATTYKAGDLIRVTLSFELTKERRFVAVTDPLPAGLEPVESWFATTAASLARNQDDQGEES